MASGNSFFGNVLKKRGCYKQSSWGGESNVFKTRSEIKPARPSCHGSISPINSTMIELDD